MSKAKSARELLTIISELDEYEKISPHLLSEIDLWLDQNPAEPEPEGLRFKEIVVQLPKHDADVVIEFPGGEQLTIQARPSNADVDYNGSLDIILPTDQAVTNWRGDDMEPAPEFHPEGQHPETRYAKQLVTDLPGDYES